MSTTSNIESSQTRWHCTVCGYAIPQSDQVQPAPCPACRASSYYVRPVRLGLSMAILATFALIPVLFVGVAMLVRRPLPPPLPATQTTSAELNKQ